MDLGVYGFPCGWTQRFTILSGLCWLESLLSTFHVRSFLQVDPRLKFQKWFHSFEHHILLPCQSEDKTTSLPDFNKTKEAFSPRTPRKSLLAFYWPKLGHVLTAKAIFVLGKGWVGSADWLKFVRAHLWNRIRSFPLKVGLFTAGNLGWYHYERGEMVTGSKITGTYYNVQSHDKYHCPNLFLAGSLSVTVTTLMLISAYFAE